MKARELFYAPPPAAQGQPKTDLPKKATTLKQAIPKVDPKRNTEPISQTEVPKVPVMNVALTPLALRYSVLKRNTQGAFEETDSDSTFRSGDRIRLNVQANDTGYLYVVMRGSTGAWRVLFPAPEEAGGDNRVVKGKNYTVPAGKNGQFFFDETGGEEKLFLVLTRKPEGDLESLVYSMADKERRQPDKRQMLLAENRPAINDSMVERLRSGLKSRDLVFEKVDEEAGEKKEKAVYVANPIAAPEARLVVDVLLKHGK
jgi:hypothetical protein